MNAPTIRKLLKQCADGERTAQRSLFNHFYGYGLTVALFYGSNREDAEEILQDSFLNAFRALERQAPPTDFKAWFRRIIINRSIDYYRSRQQLLALISNLGPSVQTTQNEAISTLACADLHQLTQQLPPAYRLVFNLHVLEGYTHREIAGKLGISVGSSKSNLSKARKYLQQLFPAYYSIDKPISNA